MGTGATLAGLEQAARRALEREQTDGCAAVGLPAPLFPQMDEEQMHSNAGEQTGAAREGGSRRGGCVLRGAERAAGAKALFVETFLFICH